MKCQTEPRDGRCFPMDTIMYSTDKFLISTGCLVPIVRWPSFGPLFLPFPRSFTRFVCGQSFEKLVYVLENVKSFVTSMRSSCKLSKRPGNVLEKNQGKYNRGTHCVRLKPHATRERKARVNELHEDAASFSSCCSLNGIFL